MSLTHTARHAAGIADDLPGADHAARHAAPVTFVDRVNRRLSDYIGFPTTWEDLVGDWPEADHAETDDVEGAVQWILAECGH